MAVSQHLHQWNHTQNLHWVSKPTAFHLIPKGNKYSHHNYTAKNAHFHCALRCTSPWNARLLSSLLVGTCTYIFNINTIIIAENFDEVLANWVKIANLKINAAWAPMTLGFQITKFKFRQYPLRAVSPNFMLIKITRSTVGDFRLPTPIEVKGEPSNVLINRHSTMVVTFWPIRLLRMRLINHLTYKLFINQPATY